MDESSKTIFEIQHSVPLLGGKYGRHHLWFFISYHPNEPRGIRALLQKLIISQPAKKFPTFYGTPSFITVFTKTRGWAPSRAT